MPQNEQGDEGKPQAKPDPRPDAEAEGKSQPVGDGKKSKATDYLASIAGFSGLAAFFLGLISVTLKPVVPKSWPDFFVGLGIALLVYATASLTLWVVIGTLCGASEKHELGQESQEEVEEEDRSDNSKISEGRQYSSSDDLRDTLNLVFRIIATLLSLGALGVVLVATGVAAPLPFWQHFGKTAGVGLLLSLGFFAAGALFGFLFGLPRSPRKSGEQRSTDVKGSIPQEDRAKQSTPSAEDRTAYGDNTNLEEISDWLTKIIVGLGLIDLKDMPDQFKRAARFFAATCGNEFCGGVFLTMGIFFFVLGFISSFIFARVNVMLAFSLLGRELNSPLKKRMDALVNRVEKVDALSLVQEARFINDYQSANEKQLDVALRLIDKALGSEVTAYSEFLAYVERGRALKRKATLRDKGSPEYVKLLEDALNAVEKAKKLGPSYGTAQYNAACYKSLLGRNVNEILADLRESFRLVPKLKGAVATDHDFDDVRNLAEFKAEFPAPKAEVNVAPPPPPDAKG